MPNRQLVIFIAAALINTLSAAPPRRVTPGSQWTDAATMQTSHLGACSAMLPDGSLLIAGGTNPTGAPLATAEIYDAAGSFRSTAPMQTPRTGHFCVALPDGRVLAAGGRTTDGTLTNLAETYDPTLGRWSPSGFMTAARTRATATVLRGGSVLVTGGDGNASPLASIEIFEPAAATFSAVSSPMISPRTGHAAALLKSGAVLIAGGSNGQRALDQIEIYDPETGLISSAGHMSRPREGLTATSLGDGRVLLAGGSNAGENLATAEVFDPRTGLTTPVGDMISPRANALAFLLPDNNTVLVAGGASRTAELFIPWKGVFTRTHAPIHPLTGGTASAMKQRGTLFVAEPAAGTVAAHGESYSFPTVTTDQKDYVPGQTVTITGAGFAPNESITLQVIENPDLDGDSPISWVVTADGDGAFSDSTLHINAQDLGVTFTLVAVGETSGLTAGAYTFTDGFSTSTSVSCHDTTVGVQTTCSAVVTVDAAACDSAYSSSTCSPPAPTGSVSFSTGAQCTLVGNVNSQYVASCSINYTPASAGPQPIVADYLGDGTDSGSSGSTTLNVAGLPDLTISKAHNGSGFYQTEQGASYTLAVSNNGTAATSGVIGVSDTLPAGLTFSSATGDFVCSASGQTVYCSTSGALGIGGTAYITMYVNVSPDASFVLANAASVSCTCQESNTGNNTSNIDYVGVTQLPDLTIAKSHVGSGFRQAQQGAQYLLAISNGGSAPSTGSINVTDALPSGLTFVSGSGGGFSCSANGQLVTCSGSPSIGVGSTAYITLTVNVGDHASPTLSNAAAVSCTCTEKSTSNNVSNTDYVSVTQLPDLTISKSHTGSNFTQAQQGAQYKLTVSNGGSASATGTIALTDTLPTGLTFASGSGGGFNCSANGQSVTCTNTSTPISSNGTAVITLNVNVGDHAAPTLSNSATVACSCQETHTDNNTSNVDTVSVTQLPDLTISKSHVGSNFTQAQQGAQYKLTVSNGGSAAATGTITLTDTLPTGLTFASGSGGGFSCSASGQSVTCTTSTPISSNGTAVITLNVNVGDHAAPTLSNSAAVACSCQETHTDNNTSNVDNVSVTQLPDLTILKSHVGSNFTQAQQGAQYNITVSNGGSAAATGTITLTDTLPTGLTFASGSGGGFSCSASGQSVTCTNTSTPISSNGTAVITLNVNVGDHAAPTLSNSAAVACSCQETHTDNNTSNVDNVSVTQLPDLTISKSHVGNFRQGQQGAQYTFTVSNTGSATASGTITVTDSLPAGLAFAGGSGGGFNCSASGQLVTCVNSSAAVTANGTAVVNMFVNVDQYAAPNLTNTAIVACSCQETHTSNNTSNIDPLIVIQVADLTITKTHRGDFSQNEVGAVFTLTVHNVGPGPTVGTVTVTDNLPAGLFLTSIGGSGWNCNPYTVTCTRSDVLGVGGAYPPISVAVWIAGNAPPAVTNVATVAGGGELNTSNDTAQDTAKVIQMVSVTFATSPAGESVEVDGTIWGAPHTFTWPVGTIHTINAFPPSGQSFVSWSDGGAASHNIAAPSSDTTFTVTYQ